MAHTREGNSVTLTRVRDRSAWGNVFRVFTLIYASQNSTSHPFRANGNGIFISSAAYRVAKAVLDPAFFSGRFLKSSKGSALTR